MADALVGTDFPTATLESSRGGNVTLPQAFRGKWNVVYFYPKDDTPGCTRQACGYRDHLADFEREGIQVFGVSSDDLGSHDSFVKKFSLNFPLLADTQQAISRPLGVFGEQEWQGKKYEGLSRDTFLVDPDGKIRQVWRKVSPDQTIGETLEAARSFMKG